MNQKGFSSIVIILIVVGVLALAGGVYYFAVQKPSQPEQPQPVLPTQPEEQQPSPIDETANWKTYRNEEYGVEFKYPKNWEIKYDESGYQRAACDDPEYRKTDSGCVRIFVVSLGKIDEEKWLGINVRQCTNIIKLSKGHYICYDSALPLDSPYLGFTENGEMLQYLDSETRKVIDTIKNSYRVE